MCHIRKHFGKSQMLSIASCGMLQIHVGDFCSCQFCVYQQMGYCCGGDVVVYGDHIMTSPS